MGIKKSFAGSSIRKPGSYSKSKVDNSAGAPLGTNDILLIVGEAQLGIPGATEGIQEFSASQIDVLVEKYGRGPIVDAALVATRPGNPSQVPGGAGVIKVYKTNASTQADLTIDNAVAVALFDIEDRFYGQPGNNISVTIAAGTTGNQRNFSILKTGETTEALGENDAQAQLSVQYTGDGTTATYAITGASKAAKTFVTTLAGDQTDGSVNLSIAMQNLTMKELADQINGQTGYTASLSYAPSSAKDSTELDHVTTATDVKTAAVSLYRLREEMVDLINENSSFAEATLAATPVEGVPALITNQFLTGGALGASSNTNFSSGFTAALGEDANVIIPLVSQDASDDISLGSVSGFVTDGSSAYTISSVLAALKSHLILRGNVKNRKEAQGMAGVRAATKAAAYAESTTLVSELVQLALQDVRVSDVDGNLNWKQPHIKAAIAAGIRLGTDVGEPLTHKFANLNDVGHYVNPTTGVEGGDFDPQVDVDNAIDNGMLFLEKVAGGWRFVVDNTTYGADQSFVWNRGSVIEAAQFVAKSLRETSELVFVGKKVSNGIAASIKSVLNNKLIELNQAEIITASDDGAPNGFVESTFVVEVQGNTASVQVEIKPVQGLDFVFITFTLGDISQSA